MRCYICQAGTINVFCLGSFKLPIVGNRTYRNEMALEMSGTELEWIQGALDKSASAYFNKFGIEDKQRGHLRYDQLLRNKSLSDELRQELMDQVQVWKVDKAPQFWLNRCARLMAIKTAATLVEGSAPYAEEAILQNAATVNASRVKDRLYQQKDQGLPVQHKNRDSFNQPQDKDRPGQQEAGSKEDSDFEELGEVEPGESNGEEDTIPLGKHLLPKRRKIDTVLGWVESSTFNGKT